MIHVFPATEADPRLVEAFERLIPQLSASLSVPAATEIGAVVLSSSTVLFCAERQGVIVGMASLAWYDVPSGRHAWIEDVVVDAACRRCGAGRALIRAALDYAAQIGAGKVSLTSHPSRTAAHALYREMGFEEYDTTLFRYKLK